QRAERALPLINSLWIWGGGVLPVNTGQCFDRVVTANVTVQGLGSRSSSNCSPVPERADSLLSEPGEGERVLVTLDALDAPAAYEDIGRWNTVLEHYERDWFAPLLSALAARRLTRLDVFPVNGQCFSITPADLLKFWRRTRSYRDVLSPLTAAHPA
ncbi:MAG: hypothetical protein ACE5FQ_09440, partial [Thiogranum sp.]